ncbi:hypothetical protein GGI42DRAFT_323500 [Trichoderma sp. SZMC 28013]
MGSDFVRVLMRSALGVLGESGLLWAAAPVCPAWHSAIIPPSRIGSTENRTLKVWDLDLGLNTEDRQPRSPPHSSKLLITYIHTVHTYIHTVQQNLHSLHRLVWGGTQTIRLVVCRTISCVSGVWCVLHVKS